MPTYNGHAYSSTRNINVKGGLIRFGKTYAANPFGTDEYGIYVNSSGNLIYSKLGVNIIFTFTSLSPSVSPSASVSPSVSPS